MCVAIVTICMHLMRMIHLPGNSWVSHNGLLRHVTMVGGDWPHSNALLVVRVMCGVSVSGGDSVGDHLPWLRGLDILSLSVLY